jgi:cellulose synthase operon protein C
MKPFHYAVFLGLLAVGLGGSVLLVPHQDELGLMFFKARQYPQARRILEERLAAGEHSIDVVVPLAEILVQSGDVERALALLRRFPVRPAERIALAKRIGQFERYGQLTWDYLHTLEEINRTKRSEDTLRELANLYRYFNLTEQLAATLGELIAHCAAGPSDFAELANLEAIEGRPSHAAQTLDELGRRHPEAVTGATVEFLISVLLDAGDTVRAEERAVWWLARHNLPEEAIRLAGLMDSRGKPGLGLRLLKPFDAAADTNPPLLAEWIQLQMAAGAPQAAFERLEILRRTRRIPEELAEPFVELALARHDLDSAIALAEEKGLERFPNWLLANLAETAMAEKRDDFVHRMVARLKGDFLAARPLLGARLALARGDRAGAVDWLRRAAADPQLRGADRLAVAGHYMHLGRRQEAFEQVSEVPLENLAEAELVEAARIYGNLDKATEGAQRFDPLRLRGGHPGAAAGWALLAAGAGRGHEALALLGSLPGTSLSEDVLKDLYYTAADHKEPDLAAECARRLYKNRGGDDNRLLLATALTGAGQPVEALPHLRALIARRGHDDAERNSINEAYTAALRSAAQHSEPATAVELRAELRAFWTAQLKRAGLDEKHRLNMIYGMLEIQAWDEALPSLAELAQRHAELVPLYVQSAVEAGRKPDAVSFLKSELDRKDLKPADRETRLYALIEHGGNDVALPYISRLAWSSGGPWIVAYEDALRKLGRMEELAAFWRSQARLPGASAEEKRSLAFKLLDAARKDWALEIFLDLAGTAKPDQQDISDLLFLWGPKPGMEALTWLEQRARGSTGEERAAWWKHMLALGAAKRVAVMGAESVPEPGQGGSLLETYLRAQAQLGDNRSFAAALTREIGAVDDPERARSLARLARESGVAAAAETAYSRLLTLAASDLEALHWLGMYSFTRANYSAAERHLQPLLQDAQGSYEDNFYYAELLWRKGDRRAARAYYGRALRLIERLPAPPPEARAAYAHSLAHCGFIEKALSEFRTLVGARPDNADVRADFVALLLEESRYGEAGQVLSGDAGSNGRLIELRAQLLAATARKPEALRLMEDFTSVYPDRARALAGLASLDVSTGRQRQARGLLRRAASLEPENEDFGRAIQDLDREQSPRIETEALSRSIQGAQSEDLMRVVGEQVMGAFRLHFGVDQDVASVRSVRSPEGKVAPFRGVLRRGEASVQYELEDGMRLEGTVDGGETGPGAGASVVHPDGKGASTLRIELGRPYWEFAESLAGGGTRDRVEIRKETVLGPRLSARLGAALNRYSLQHLSGAGTSVAGQGAVTFRLATQPNVNLEYNFDGEYRLSAATRVGPDGAEFHPLPLVSREVHSVSIAAGGRLTRTLEGNAASGFAIDRFGGRAPFVSMSLKYAGRGRFGAGIDLDRRLYFLDTARTVTTIGGRLTFRF